MYDGTLRRVNWSIFTEVLKDHSASETSVENITSSFSKTTEKTVRCHADSAAHVFLTYLTSNPTGYAASEIAGYGCLSNARSSLVYYSDRNIYLFRIHPQSTYFSGHPHHKCTQTARPMYFSVAYPGILFRGVQQIQLRTEDRENGDLGALAPLVRGFWRQL